MAAVATIPAAQVRRGMVLAGKGAQRRTVTRVVLSANKLMRWEYVTQFGDTGSVTAALRDVLLGTTQLQVVLQ